MSWKRYAYILLVIFVAGIAGFVGALAGSLAAYQAIRQGQFVNLSAPTQAAFSDSPSDSNQPQALVIDSTDIQTSITRAVQVTEPAVVTVIATISAPPSFFGQGAEQTVSGSGVFISNKGYILTNNHVVEGSDQLSVTLSDGSQQAATIVGTDIYADLAVLKTDGKVPAVAQLGNSDVLDMGETVIAIGSPLGDLTNTITVGVISATGRSIDTGQGYQIEGLIQTDAAINEGNSGGPLVNLAGEVIGINTLVLRSSGDGSVAEGLGFALPVNTAKAVAEQIIQKGYFSRPYLGIRWQAINPYIAMRYDLPAQWGVYVTDVAANSPASQAGLQPGDIITRIGEVSIDETHSYFNALFQYQPGDMVTLRVVRNYREFEVEVRLGESNSG